MGSPLCKRVFDLLITVPVFILTLPVQAAVAVLIAKKLGRPVLFRQQRPGLRAEPFELIKFRTMMAPDPNRGLVDDASRLTDFGAKLRAMSLDELPTLLNIIRGDMSLVGPRPLLMQYLDRYTPEQARRHEVRPGLTGLAQISGRNDIEWDRKLALDVAYVDRISMVVDLRILAATARKVVRRDGITAPGQATTTEFMGSAGTLGSQ